MGSMVKTVWENSSKSEAERLLHCAHQMAVGFYRVNNFIVLPYTPKIDNVHIVTFPDFPYNTISIFFEYSFETQPVRPSGKPGAGS